MCFNYTEKINYGTILGKEIKSFFFMQIRKSGQKYIYCRVEIYSWYIIYFKLHILSCRFKI